jgi:Lrp/AsnC family transcriptional regulator
MSMEKLDQIDRALLRALQRDASLSQRELAETVGLSQNACWRRLKALQESGLIKGQTIRLDAQQLGLGLTVFVMVRTRNHSYRIAGDYDYMLKVVAEDMNAFDQIYQRLTAKVELETVTSYITMEAIADARDLPV